ncbi:hypothetical protein C815_00933 [Firmicutes bacterium M10-2]|jgi:hypothetical protein|nr:hypothetical protein C815_00933 [Firmicutes bacterium M10-2]
MIKFLFGFAFGIYIGMGIMSMRIVARKGDEDYDRTNEAGD